MYTVVSRSKAKHSRRTVRAAWAPCVTGASPRGHASPQAHCRRLPRVHTSVLLQQHVRGL